jgi:hypothetical protein
VKNVLDKLKYILRILIVIMLNVLVMNAAAYSLRARAPQDSSGYANMAFDSSAFRELYI